MTRQFIGNLNGKPTYFVQCQTLDEATAEKLPKGSFFFWEQEGERIFSPGEIVRQVQQSVMSQTFEPASLLNEQTVRKYYDDLVNGQRSAILDQFRATRKEFAENPMYPREALQHFDDTIKFWEQNFTMPAMNGTAPGMAEAIRGDR